MIDKVFVVFFYSVFVFIIFTVVFSIAFPFSMIFGFGLIGFIIIKKKSNSIKLKK